MSLSPAWRRSAAIALSLTLFVFALAHGCTPDGQSEFDDGGSTESGNGSGGAGGFGLTVGSGGSGAGNFVGDPKTCEEAAASASYVGCDFFPTVTPNPV